MTNLSSPINTPIHVAAAPQQWIEVLNVPSRDADGKRSLALTPNIHEQLGNRTRCLIHYESSRVPIRT